MSHTITNFDDLIDVRDVIARVEELEVLQAQSDRGSGWDALRADAELASLRTFLSELCGTGGYEKWRGDWYPAAAIRYDYFEDYAQQLAEDIGAVSADNAWPNNCIDWERAARELRMDYTGVEFNGVTYYVR